MESLSNFVTCLSSMQVYPPSHGYIFFLYTQFRLSPAFTSCGSLITMMPSGTLHITVLVLTVGETTLLQYLTAGMHLFSKNSLAQMNLS